METAITIDLGVVARRLELPESSVASVIELLDEGNTVPFITRYRRDQTGGMDEEQIRHIQEAVTRLRMMAERKQTILRSIDSQGKLTDALAEQIAATDSPRRLEDLYLPFKPKKQTLATIAREKGLQPLADEVLANSPAARDLDIRARDFIDPDKRILTVPDVLLGVGHLLAEQFSEDAELRGRLREIYNRTGKLVSRAVETQPARGESEKPAAPPAGATRGETDTEPPPAEPPPAVPPPAEPPPEVAPEASAGSDAAAESPPEPIEKPEPALEAEAPPAAPASAPAKKKSKKGKDEARQEQAEERREKRAKKKEREREQREKAFRDYFHFDQAVGKAPPHRILAINRGEKARVLKVKIDADFEQLQRVTEERLVPADHPHADFLRGVVKDALSRLIIPSLERELRRDLTDNAESHAVEVFARNLRNLLLVAPVHGKRVLAVDPGFRSGCKLAALDEFGNVHGHGVMHFVGGEARKKQGRAMIVEMALLHRLDVIAIGNGAGCRETETLVSEILADELKDADVAYVVVNEAGASVYSTSPAGREELPQYDATLRGAISIGRRLQDPLSELVKINPSNIGVGLYQHDMKAKHLRESLDAVVESCVNYVGVDLNTASPALLRYVSGLNQLTARRLYERRQKGGPFQNREELKDVTGFGAQTFTQAAGFLKIPESDDPLDATWIHPESYEIARRVVEKLGSSLSEFHTNGRAAEPPVDRSAEPPADCDEAPAEESAAAPQQEESAEPPPPPGRRCVRPPRDLVEKLKTTSVDELAAELGVGKMLLADILRNLRRPGRDPREDLPKPIFRRGVVRLEDLEPGMELAGSVLNVVDFGVFVDIGMHDSGLIHISRLSTRYVQDPHDVVSVGDTLRVWVHAVDKQRRRVSLTAIEPGQEKEKPQRPRGRPGPAEGGDRPPREALAPPRGDRPRQQGDRKPGGAGVRRDAGKPAGGRDAKAPRESREGRGGRRGDRRQGKGTHFEKNRQPRTYEVKPKEPASPITKAMKEGRAPLRSFADLQQFLSVQSEPEPAKEDAANAKAPADAPCASSPPPEESPAEVAAVPPAPNPAALETTDPPAHEESPPREPAPPRSPEGAEKADEKAAPTDKPQDTVVE